MNCPHHTQIFARKIHSYKELPARYAETTMVYRDEQSGELGGLTRVLSITQDDSHIFCRSLEIKEEFYKVWDIIDTLYKTFDFTLHTRLSFSDKKDFSKYLGTKEVWEKSEKALLELAEERGANYFIAEGEAAMYGPKVDFMAKDSLGREHQVATIQLDMNLPERFDLSCINEKGEKERVVIIHSAIMGSLERFIAILIEHLHGEFPFRFSPVQIIIIPLSENHYAYSETILSLLKEAGIRAHNDKRNEPLGKRIKTAKEESAFYTLVIGDKEKETDTFFLEHKNGKEEVKKENLISFLKNK
jgi:threonyl-tRNA synthetase